MVRTVKMEQDCQVGKPMPAADPNLTSPDNHHDLTASAREEVGSTKENEGDSTHMDQSNAQEKPVMKTKMEPSSTKLCGYLNKLGGPLKAWKARWFVFEEKKCQLYYYRTSQDVNPLGSIDLANATFGYPDQAQEGTFQIQIPGRVVVLKALNSQAMLYWLQQLQIKRWQHNTSLVKIPAEASTTSTQLCQLPSAPWEGRTEDFLPAVKTPKGLVGEAAACLPDPWQQNALQKLSLKHPITEIQNTVLNICGNKPAQELRRSVFNFDKIQQSQDCPCEDPVTQILGETTAPPVPLTPPAPTVLSAPSVSSVTNESAQEAKTGGKSSPSSSMNKREKKMTSSLQPSGEVVSGKEGSPVDKLSRLQHEVFTLTEELKSQKELVRLLHKALEAAQQEKRTSKQFLAAAGEQERLELVRHKERCIADLDGRLEALLKDKEELEQRLAMQDCQVNELQQHVQLMMEKNNAKQEVILKLSEQVAACMADPQRTVANSMGTETFCRLQEKIEHLKDDIEAHKIQNKFLNSEVYQLTKLWRNSSEEEKGLLMKCAYLEAKNCQIESKYLVMLRRLQESKGLDSSQQEMVKRLIEDALQGDKKDVFKLNPVSEYDDYGFKTIPDYEVEDVKLLAKIQALEIRSNNLRNNEMVDKPLRTRWANYLASRPLDQLAPSPELKGLIRCGIPVEYREQVWRWIVRTRTQVYRKRNPNRYQELRKHCEVSEHPASRQIRLDLHRTLTSNKHFSSPTSDAVQKLQRILLAFSWQNPTIGYCQGLNRLAAIALLVLKDEEDAFWCLVAVVEIIMPQDYYSKTLTASQADQRVFRDFLAEKMPRLTAHFKEHSIDHSLITFNWFLVVFVESLVSDILLRVWDAFLYEGTKVIFRYALALFKYNEEDILKIHDNLEIYQYLRFFTKTISDGRKLMTIAFNDMNPFPMKLLKNRREFHMERLTAELQELERIQEEFVKEQQVERKDKDLDTAVSEDEEETNEHSI
ncbi:TBC1 domain family member 2A-like isoform X3 [Acipenser ruthenus]|uniref:TBC1 domain family member 2A-like isoform X3 n=1 Tax=Acipenser ruthenus TaxID=7906 RepID=UPI002741C759|nr:TBC1 domain family member 2A-like isoform X3 [Acipenser ruthenus]